MGNLFSPVPANFFIKHFEKKPLPHSLSTPIQWFHYLDDTFVVWQSKVNEFQNFPNFTIKFTFEMENDNEIHIIINIMYKRNPSGSLYHSLSRKPAHINTPFSEKKR